MAKYGDALTKPETTDAKGTEQGKEGTMEKMKHKMKQLRIASGETHGEAEIPVTRAPLIFPALEAVAEVAEKESDQESVGIGIKAKSKSATKFVNEYYDRRAQARYATANPNSTLTAQMAPVAPQFNSRFADPNNAVNTHLFTLLTGGRYKAEPGRRPRSAQGLKVQPSKRLLQEGVLNLMVVNMPTEQELERARKAIQEAKEAKAKKKAA
ncbi:hypothetical protein MMC08_000979 [Hypocenomyce scalaris]|nr:hypothetical protein [Hypocenomyce scalaris]